MKLTTYLNEIKSPKRKFIIPKELTDKYKYDISSPDPKNWTAQVIQANNGSKKGKIEAVGYVGVHLGSNVIVPIARGDEHRTGFELLYSLARRKLIPPYSIKSGKKETYMYQTVFLLGQDYVYSKPPYSPNNEDSHGNEEEKKVAYQKLKEYGLDANINVNWMTEYDSNYEYLSGSVDDYLNGTLKIEKKSLDKTFLTPTATKLLELLKSFSLTYSNYLLAKEPQKEFIGKKMCNDVAVIYKFIIDRFNLNIAILTDDIRKKMMEDLAVGEGKKDYEKVASIILSHNGIKNLLHMKLKECVENKKSFVYRDLVKIFGPNLEEMIMRLTLMSNI